MEIERLIKQLENVTSNVRDSYVKDITTIVNSMLCDYDIFYKDTNQRVNANILINKFKTNLQKQKSNIVCCGISKNGNRCTKKALDDSDYCKTHNYLEQRSKINNKDENLYIITNTNNNTNQNNNDLQLKFIEDSFYYIDNEYIYDRDTMENVGYIYEDQYILSNDPFV
jgi:hypothetical protein